MLEPLIWVDKYRPKTFDDIVGQKFFISRVRSFIKSKSLPHLLLSGQPGIGKTTTALIVAYELYGESGRQGNVLELNASDDRGIDVIRHTIKEFARLKSLVDVPYKLIILDEADSLTKEAQQALRRTMEKYSASCRFILACNEISKIIDPIQSRCVIFRFRGLEFEEMGTLLEKIAKGEGLTLEDDAKRLLIESCRGDMRKLVNLLQSASSLNSVVSVKCVEEVLNSINPREIKTLMAHAFSGDFSKTRSYLLVLRVKRAFSSLEILKEIYNYVIEMEMEDLKKIKVVERIAETEFRLVEGSDEELQLESLLVSFGNLK